MMPTVRYKDLKNKLYHISTSRRNELLMSPMIYPDRDINGNVTELRRLCVSSSIKGGINAICPLKEIEIARLSGQKFKHFYVYEPVLNPGDHVVIPSTLKKHKLLYDIDVTEEHWLVTDRDYNLVLKEIISVSTSLTHRKVINYNLFGDKEDEVIAVVPTHLKKVVVKPLKGRPTNLKRHILENTEAKYKSIRQYWKNKDTVYLAVSMDTDSLEPGEFYLLFTKSPTEIPKQYSSMLTADYGIENLEEIRIKKLPPIQYRVLTISNAEVSKIYPRDTCNPNLNAQWVSFDNPPTFIESGIITLDEKPSKRHNNARYGLIAHINYKYEE